MSNMTKKSVLKAVAAIGKKSAEIGCNSASINATTANKLSDSKKISSLGATYTIPYTTYRGTGSISYIHATSSYYGSNVSGYWYA